MRTLVWLGSAITLFAAAAVPACGSGDLGAGGGSSSGNCNSACAAMLKAQCPNTGTQQSCLQECQGQVATVPSRCAAQLNGVMSCYSTATWTCDSSGDATTSSCSSQGTALETCETSTGSGGAGGTGGTGATGGANCTSVCTRMVAAACPADTQSSCVSGCQTLQNLSASSCSSQFNALLACRATATFSCNSSGNAETTGCTSQATTLTTCLSAGTGGTGGWTCSSTWYGSNDGCDCGCTLPDPDCAGSGCSAPGCNDLGAYTVCATSN